MVLPVEVKQQYDDFQAQKEKRESESFSYLTDIFRQIAEHYHDDMKKIQEIEKRLGVKITGYDTVNDLQGLDAEQRHEVDVQRSRLLQFVGSDRMFELAKVFVEIHAAKQTEGN